MLRTALKPRWLGLLVVVALVIVAFIQLGRWQLGVARDKAAVAQLRKVASEAPVDVTTVLAPLVPFPNDASSRPVYATGRYAAGQVLVPDRRLDGRTGYWLITPFVVDGSGVRLPVLRGFLTSPSPVPPPPAGRLTVHGGLAPGESPSTMTGLPPGQIGSVDVSVLVNTWPGQTYNAFLFLQRETAASGPVPSGSGAATGDAVPSTLNTLTHVPTPLPDTGLQWRNAAYALQWWVFAGFAAYMWWRMVRDDRDRSRGGADPEAGAGGTDPPPDPRPRPDPAAGPAARVASDPDPTPEADLARPRAGATRQGRLTL